MYFVSVIMPYFKKKEYVERSILSVINQTYKNLELIIIYDDESMDDFGYISNICDKFKNIKVIRNIKNLGAGESRNIGIKSATGDLVAFIDADDYWFEEKLEKQINFLQKNNHKFIFCNYIKKSQNSEKEIVCKKEYLSYSNLLKSCDIGLSTVLLRTNIIKSNRFPNLKAKEDFVLWLNLILDNVKIYGMDENLVLWKKSKNSLSSSTLQKLLDGFRVYNSYMKFNIFKSIYYLLCLSLNYFKK